MSLSKILKNTFLVILLSLVVSACATKKTSTISDIDSQIQGDVYVGTDTVGELAKVSRIEFSLQQMNLS